MTKPFWEQGELPDAVRDALAVLEQARRIDEELAPMLALPEQRLRARRERVQAAVRTLVQRLCETE